MWVTQTYLGTVEPDAKLFVYYFFEDYNPDQRTFTQRVQRELEKLGEVFGDQVSLLMPNPRYAGRIEAEMKNQDKLWSLHGELPGLFLSRKPLAKLEPDDDGCIYVTFKTQDAKGVAEVIRRIRGVAYETLSSDFAKRSEPKPESLAKRFGAALELKPGIWGFKIDLRKLFQRQ